MLGAAVHAQIDEHGPPFRTGFDETFGKAAPVVAPSEDAVQKEDPLLGRRAGGGHERVVQKSRHVGGVESGSARCEGRRRVVEPVADALPELGQLAVLGFIGDHQGFRQRDADFGLARDDRGARFS